jgi:hypothetical protein
MSLFEYVRHPHVEARRRQGPVKVADQHAADSAYARFNTRVALATTGFVGSMNCAWLFAAIALISLPAAIASGSVIVIVSWVAQTLLQLVLLSVIMVGQNVQSQAADKRAEATYLDAESVLHEAAQIQAHLQLQDDRLEAQDRALSEQTATLQAIVARLTAPGP